MSELFKALQKLEEQNEVEVPPPFSSSSGHKKPKNSPPFLKSVLVCVLLLVVTGVCLGLVWFAKDSLLSSFTVLTSGADIKKEQNIPVIDPVSELSPDNGLQAATLLPEPEPAVQKSFSPAKEPPPLKKEVTSQYDTKKESSVAETHIEIHPKIQKASLEKYTENSTSDMEKEQDRLRQRKQIYRAEKIREQGDLPKALLLYKKAWSFGPDPDIANNLAALLIQSGKYDEAIQYLQQVLPLAPDDEDLIFNLKIALEGKKRKNKFPVEISPAKHSDSNIEYQNTKR